jgi:hypothetical protein
MTPFERIVQDMISPTALPSGESRYCSRRYFAGKLRDDFLNEHELDDLWEARG